ncbi:Nucleoside transporter family protein [Trichomonas vaginalis G3]|uniref:Nucleoside transporter family protein n=1 Tax=Trichomonas vaginalis (strain ATCC PRA-98 / G3) TaxID=412133 RepID=A2DE45_TRIV3|nr:nucleoside transmembrane transporter protein [Trichomonas vaginalis G3]EAY21263.1 Nucleoside transporter family protein [Trichomonas vaginalis G3]KAI5548837.1 nucleoside transmembrane transporter protein [Trichomonas vaginalis G3]|eukprot:XP_001582249.1 Nucleoside transporter family protein [Trichomonas vaginalis G3]
MNSDDEAVTIDIEAQSPPKSPPRSPNTKSNNLDPFSFYSKGNSNVDTPKTPQKQKNSTEKQPITPTKQSNADANSVHSRDIEIPNEDEDKITFGIEAIFMLLGTNVLFSYNTFINGLDFYDTLFPGKNAPTNIARAYNITASLIYIFSLPFIERFTLVTRFYFSSIGITIMMFFTFLYSNIGTPIYGVIIGAAVFAALFSGILFGTTMGFAGLFGANCSSVCTAGLALGGLVTSIVRVLSKLMGKGEGWFYFGFTVVFNTCSVIAFILFKRRPIAIRRISHSHTSTDFLDRMKRIKGVFLKIWPFVLEACLCMMITLTLFPGYACSIKSKHGLSKDWVTTLVTSFYMVGDFFGRLFTRWWAWPSAKWLWVPHISRLIFFVLYIIPIESVFLEDDIFIYFVTLALALTGGFWIGLCITYTAKDEKLEEDEVELAVFCTSLALNLGIFIGSWLTYALPTH